MRRISIILTFISFLFGVTSIVSAAQTTIASKPAMQWHCLQNTYCAKAGANCAQAGEAAQNSVLGHRVKLTTKSTDLPSRNAPTGVFVCVGTKQGNICTSGDSSVDTNMLGYDGLTKLNQVVGYKFQGLFRSTTGERVSPKDIMSNDVGKLSVSSPQAMNWEFPSTVYAVAKAPQYQLVEPLEMQDYTPVGLPRKWLALNLVQAIPLAVGKGGEQQGTFTFEGALGRCASISWDPYGIVFDSQSLEPVADVKVTLTKMRANGIFTLAAGDDAPSILNPVTTIEDGAFEFFVPDGTYRLNLNTLNFTFPSTRQLNPNITKIYSEIYYGEDIVEQGGAQHRDVPIDSKTTPYHSSVKLISYFPLLDKGTNTMIIQGKVSHPLTQINIYGKKPSGDEPGTFARTRLLTTFITDTKGQFDIRYSMNQLGPAEAIGDIEFIKPDYLTMQYSKVSDVKNDTLVVEPILNYLEGYAYDQNSKVIPNATVGVYLNLSNKPAYETTADANGFYRISSEFLPSMSYGIRYSGSNGIVPLTTSKFIAQNAKYLETQAANLFVYKNNKGKTFSLEERAQFTNENENTQPSPTQNQNENKAMTQAVQASNLLPLVIILVLIGLGGVAAIVYFMKKK